MNQVNLIGNIGQLPEVKRFESGKRVGRFSIAINAYSKNKNGEKPKATWIPCEVWEETLDRLLKCNEKVSLVGRKIQITGSIALNEYTKQVGDQFIPVKRLYIRVQSFELLGSVKTESTQMEQAS